MSDYGYISTSFVEKFDFIWPKPEKIDIRDIARSLSMQCRFNGHVNRFYSVAEHCVLMADYVLDEFGDKQLAFDALLHDASEAYLCDIPSPLKPHIANYYQLESTIQKAIQAKFGAKPINNWLMELDAEMAADEAIGLFSYRPEWVNDYPRTGIVIKNWEPMKAEYQFLLMFDSLSKALNLTG